jgi:hypothetical protein
MMSVGQTAPLVSLGEYMVTTVINGYVVSSVIDTVRESNEKHGTNGSTWKFWREQPLSSPTLDYD